MNDTMAGQNQGGVVVVNSERMGHGDDALGDKLMANFLRTLTGVEPKPEAIIFYNSAVKLMAEGSPHADALKALDEAGVDLLACITCLDFYGLDDKIAIGAKSNMREITSRLMASAKVVTL